MRLLHKIGLFALIGLCGCASYNVQKTETGAKNLNRSEFVYLALASGGNAEQNKQVQAAFEKALSDQGVSVYAGRTLLSQAAVFALAKKMDNGYVLYSEIVKWEDHNTPWSTIRDKVSISVKVIEAGSGKILARDVLEGKSTFCTMKNTAPEAILPELVSQYVETLY